MSLFSLMMSNISLWSIFSKFFSSWFSLEVLVWISSRLLVIMELRSPSGLWNLTSLDGMILLVWSMPWDRLLNTLLLSCSLSLDIYNSFDFSSCLYWVSLCSMRVKDLIISSRSAVIFWRSCLCLASRDLIWLRKSVYSLMRWSILDFWRSS